MTQPTQAQIEAAIKAYANINGINGTRHYSALLAALTAAAEVERPRRGFSSPGFEQGMQSEWDTQLAKAKAATIERCAEALNNKWMGDETAEYFLRESLALLMALKDEK